MGFFTLERQPIIEPENEEDILTIDDEKETADGNLIDNISHSPSLRKINKSLKPDYTSNKEHKIYYNPEEFQTFLSTLIEDNEKEKSSKLRATKEVIISTTEAIFDFAKATYRENRNPNKKDWSVTSKMIASQTTSNMVALIQTLRHDPDKLQMFWEKVYKPLALSGGSSEGDIDIFTSGFMNEFACGLALKHHLGDNYQVLKGTPQEDVAKGQDLIIKNLESGKEIPIQLKLLRGGRDCFVDIEKRSQPIEVRVYYRKTTDELFNPITGQPTDKLINEINKQLINEVK